MRTERVAADVPVSFDGLTEDALRAAGSLKWTRYGDAIGAFVAEMDFGTAPVVTRALHEAVDAAAFGYLPAPTQFALAEAGAAWQADRYGRGGAPPGGDPPRHPPH